jgi:hypothetical protein
VNDEKATAAAFARALSSTSLASRIRLAVVSPRSAAAPKGALRYALVMEAANRLDGIHGTGSPDWEVAFGPVEAVCGEDADSAERAATVAAAEAEFERSSKYYEDDPNPRVWVRREGHAGQWQVVYEDPEAIEAEVTAIRVREYGEEGS